MYRDDQVPHPAEITVEIRARERTHVTGLTILQNHLTGPESEVITDVAVTRDSGRRV